MQILLFALLLVRAHANPAASPAVSTPTRADDRDLTYRTTRWLTHGVRSMRIWGLASADLTAEARVLARLELAVAAELKLPRERVWSAVDATAFASGSDLFAYPAIDDERHDESEPIRFGTGANAIVRRFYALVAENIPNARVLTRFGAENGPSFEHPDEPEWRERYWQHHPLVARARKYHAGVDPARFNSGEAAGERELARGVDTDPNADPARFSVAAASFERALAQDLGVSEERIWEAASFWINPARAHAWTWVRRFPPLAPVFEAYYWRGIARISPRVHDSLRAEAWRLNRGDTVRVRTLGMRDRAAGCAYDLGVSP